MIGYRGIISESLTLDSHPRNNLPRTDFEKFSITARLLAQNWILTHCIEFVGSAYLRVSAAPLTPHLQEELPQQYCGGKINSPKTRA